MVEWVKVSQLLDLQAAAENERTEFITVSLQAAFILHYVDLELQLLREDFSNAK